MVADRSVSCYALTSGSLFEVVELHAVLRLIDVNDNLFQFLLPVDALPVAACRPNGTIDKLRPTLSQYAGAVCLELIANRAASVVAGRDNRMNVVGPRILGPDMPASIASQAFNFGFDDRLLGIS